MLPYIAISHAAADRAAAECLCRDLMRYGYRYRCVDDGTGAEDRRRTVTEAACLVAITSPEAARGGLVAGDMDLARATGVGLVCVSLGANSLDDDLDRRGETPVPAPEEENADRHSIALFVHRLFVRHLSAYASCHAAQCCVDDPGGQAVMLAVKARGGDGRAAYDLACAYDGGVGLPALENEAAIWMERAVERGVSPARIRLGQWLVAGHGVTPDPDRAYRLFAEAAEDGEAEGEYQCGLCYLYGYGVMRDPERAAYHLTRAARGGSAPALYRLGLLYRDGVGVAADFGKALACLQNSCRQAAADRPDSALDQALTDMETAAGNGAQVADRSRVTLRVPALYGHPARGRYVAITMRRFRRTYLPKTLARQGGGAGTLSHIRDFTAARITRVSLPEDDQVARLSRLVSHPRLSAGVGRRVLETYFHPTWEPTIGSAHETAYNMTAPTDRSIGDRETYAARSAFDPAAAAEALGALLESGDARQGHLPRPTRALVWYRYALCLGSTGAFCRLADAYRRGHGAPADPVRARRLYRLAAEAGDLRGQFALAVCYERGIGGPTHMSRAVSWYEQAATAGYAPAQNNLGGCYEEGFGVVQNQVAAVEWYTRAAAAGQPDAACRLGLCYESGRGVTRDMGRAAALYRSAAEAGHTYAIYRLGLLWEQGYLPATATRDRLSAVVTPAGGNVRVELVGERDGTECGGKTASEPPADLPLTVVDADRPAQPTERSRSAAGSYASRYATAARLWARAARGGVSEAAYALSVCYDRGRGVSASPEKSFYYLTMAAKGDSLQACYHLGLCFMEGRGAVQDRSRAVTWFTRAVDLWQQYTRSQRHQDRPDEERLRPHGVMSLPTAAGGALYMLGYCTLYPTGTEDDTRSAVGERVYTRRVTQAASYFRRAAALDHVGALTALGDLYAYGYLPPETANATPADEAMGHYLEAMRVDQDMPADQSQGNDEDEAASCSIHALLSLAHYSLDQARRSLDDGDAGEAETARVRAWRLLAASAEQGSVDALVDMAYCTYYGYGTHQNTAAAKWFLEHAEERSGGRVAASLWLGDCLYDPSDPVACRLADEAYRRAIYAPEAGSECGPYVLDRRVQEHRDSDRRLRAEACYRLAVLRARRQWADQDRGEAFPYLVEAIRRGHTAAREDLSRIYAILEEKATYVVPPPKRRRKAQPEDDKPQLGFDLSRAPSHEELMRAYYATVNPRPRPFDLQMEWGDEAPLPDPSTTEATRAPVTPLEMAKGLNYLGDCLFYGRGLPRDPEGAVALWRDVVSLPLTVRRGEKEPRCLTWAKYSLGWCCLHGAGTARDPREAVTWLTKAAVGHTDAAYELAVCYRQGMGVDVADPVEALKYFRKAAAGGHIRAIAEVEKLEKELKER